VSRHVAAFGLASCGFPRAAAALALALASACFGSSDPDATAPEAAGEPAAASVSGGQREGGPSPEQPPVEPVPESNLTPGNSRRPRVLRRVDENGNSSYVIELPDGSSQVDSPQITGEPGAAAAQVLSPREALERELGPAGRPDEPFSAFSGYLAAGGEADEQNEIRELELQIARDRETLKQIISQSQSVASGPPAQSAPRESGPTAERSPEDPRLREIAERLPRLQAELAALQRENQP
jgi:hypothetical protein